MAIGECAVALEAVETFSESQLCERILAADAAIVTVWTHDARCLFMRFRQISWRSGQAWYGWTGPCGLFGLRDLQPILGESAGLRRALQHVLHSTHFGVYFLGDTGPMGDAERLLIGRIARQRDGVTRKLVLLGGNPSLPGTLQGHVVNFVHGAPATPPARLRDGRWVLQP